MGRCGAGPREREDDMELLGKLRKLLVWLGLWPEEGTHYIGGSDTLPPPLTREREAELLANMDEGARQELIEHNLRLVVYIASPCIENEILMYLRKNASRRGEVSFDEPLNTDWDGNELLLSDVLGTDEDVVMRPIEEDVDRSLLAQAIREGRSRRRRRWRTGWASPSPIFPGWRSGSSAG